MTLYSERIFVRSFVKGANIRLLIFSIRFSTSVYTEEYHWNSRIQKNTKQKNKTKNKTKQKQHNKRKETDPATSTH